MPLILLLFDIRTYSLKKKESLEQEVERLIATRQEARKAKDFAKADEIRKTLADMGILLFPVQELFPDRSI